MAAHADLAASADKLRAAHTDVSSGAEKYRQALSLYMTPGHVEDLVPTPEGSTAPHRSSCRETARRYPRSGPESLRPGKKALRTGAIQVLRVSKPIPAPIRSMTCSCSGVGLNPICTLPPPR